MINLLEEASPKSEVAPPVQPSEIFFKRVGDQLVLRGRVASPELKRTIGDAASGVRDIRQVVNGIDVTDAVSGFLVSDTMANFGKLFMSQTEEGYVQWTDNQLVLRGEVRSHAAKTLIEHQATVLVQMN